jgi:hypothetical protein
MTTKPVSSAGSRGETTQEPPTIECAGHADAFDRNWASEHGFPSEARLGPRLEGRRDLGILQPRLAVLLRDHRVEGRLGARRRVARRSNRGRELGREGQRAAVGRRKRGLAGDLLARIRIEVGG